jgi:hypothetical protein
LNDAVMVPGWRIGDISDDWNLNFDPGAAETSVALSRSDAEAPVDVDIHYYVRKRGTASLLSEHNHPWAGNWHPIARSRAHQVIRGIDVPFDEIVLSNGNLKRMVWSTYWVDGRFATSSLPLRLMEFRSGIVHGHSAVLGFSTFVTSSNADARRRLGVLLAAFPDLPGALAKAGDLPAQTR